MRILIVGSDANAYSIAKKMNSNESVDIVFTAPGFSKTNDFTVDTNIAETDFAELLDFVVANEISLTIVTSIKAIENDIAGFFSDARRLIFAPTAQASNIALYRSAAKKMLYRLKIPTMKFGIFERENQAIDYISSSRKPMILKSEKYSSGENSKFVSSFSKAKAEIENFLVSQDNKLVIEDYVQANNVTIYFLTDGYTALPIGSCLSDNEFVYAPDNYISNNLERKIINEVVYPVIDDIASRAQAYCGILGIDLLVNGDIYNVIEFFPFFRQKHLQSILPLIKSDLYDLFLSSSCGSLSDEYEYIEFFDLSTISKQIKNTNNDKLTELYDDNFHYSFSDNKNAIVTQVAASFSRAKNNIEDNIIFLTAAGKDDEC